jgi:hypothetical protein
MVAGSTKNSQERMGRSHDRNGDEAKTEICPLPADEVSALLAVLARERC